MNTQQPQQPKSNMGIKVAVIVGIVAILGGVGFLVGAKDASNAMMKKNEVMSKTSDVMMKSDTSVMMKTGEVMSKTSDVMMVKSDSGMSAMSKIGDYKPYTESELVHAKEGHHVVIFFNASWCPTCKATVKDIEANKDKIGSNIHILSADYDKETVLKQKYGVTQQHTFVEVDSSGNLIKKTTGLATVEEINDYLK